MRFNFSSKNWLSYIKFPSVLHKVRCLLGCRRLWIIHWSLEELCSATQGTSAWTAYEATSQDGHEQIGHLIPLEEFTLCCCSASIRHHWTYRKLLHVWSCYFFLLLILTACQAASSVVSSLLLLKKTKKSRTVSSSFLGSDQSWLPVVFKLWLEQK